MRFELFGRLKKHGAAPAQPMMREIPADRVRELTSQGMPEADIIKTLKDAGYSFREIDEALNMAVKTGVGEEAAGKAAPVPPALQNIPDDAVFSDENYAPETPKGYTDGSMPIDNNGGINTEELEEVVDAITEEKIEDLKQTIVKSEQLVKDIEGKVKSYTVSIDEAKAHSTEINAETEKKIGEIRAKLEEIEPKILGLERAFKDIMPNLVDSVRELKEIIHTMRTKTGNTHKPEEDFDETEEKFEDFMKPYSGKKPAENAAREQKEKPLRHN